MATKLQSGSDRVRVFGLVRDHNGRPRFDDIHGIHPQLWAMLTEGERQEIRKNGGYPANREC